MSLDLGGGKRGGGGTLNDTQDIAPSDPTAGLTQRDYSIPKPITLKDLGIVTTDSVPEPIEDDESSAPVRQYLVIEELPNRYSCKRFKDGAAFTASGDTELILISKSQGARRAIWEDKTINGIAYSYPDADDHSLRIAARVGEDPLVNPPVFQRYVPPILPEFSIIYAVEVEDGTEVGSTSLIDMNVDGRTWAIERPLTVAEQA